METTGKDEVDLLLALHTGSQMMHSNQVDTEDCNKMATHGQTIRGRTRFRFGSNNTPPKMRYTK